MSSLNDGLRRCSNKGHERIDARALKRRKVAVNEVIIYIIFEISLFNYKIFLPLFLFLIHH
jgi:hypothetical protein